MGDRTAIQINPEPKVYKKVSVLSEKLRTSRGGFCELAVEFVIPKIEAGELISMNGKLVPVPSAEAVTA